MKKKNVSIIAKLNAISLPAVEDTTIRDAKGEPFAAPVEGLFSVEWKALTATVKPFNFGLAKVNRATFAPAVMGEYFARDLAKLNAERARFAEINWGDAADGEAPADVEKAKAIAAEAIKRIDAARDYIEARAKGTGSITVKCIVSAIRKDPMPAEVVPIAEKLRTIAKDISDAAAKEITEAEAEAARAVLAKPAEAEAEAATLTAAAEAAALLRAYEISTSKDAEGIPNIYPIREAATKLIKAVWRVDAPNGVEKFNRECPHDLAVKLFGMIRKPREETRKGSVYEPYADKDTLFREVVRFLREKAEGIARAEAAEAEAKREVEAKPAKK